MSGITKDGVLQTDEVGGGGSSTTVAIGQPINATDAVVLDTNPIGDEYGVGVRIIPPVGGVEVQIVSPTSFPVTSASFATRLDEASATITYVGNAVPGSITSDPVWQIKRLNSAAGLIVEYANGSAAFTEIWDNRAALSYS